MTQSPFGKRTGDRRESWASSPAVRASMQSNRPRDTRPEIALRSAVHRLGLRYRVSAPPLPGLRYTADLLFTRAKVAVFVDGCFWHGCPEHHTVAATNAGYWAEKVRRNRERDAETDRLLRESGWHVIRIWEHQEIDDSARRIAKAVRTQSQGRRTVPDR
jgi:DNA mismatch endonuclease (patch repair protein)